jgi:hypothetical protein
MENENDEIELCYVSKPIRNAQMEITSRQVYECAKEMADKEIGRWKAHEQNPKAEKGNNAWMGVRYATDEEINAFKGKAPKEEKSGKGKNK